MYLVRRSVFFFLIFLGVHPIIWVVKNQIDEYSDSRPASSVHLTIFALLISHSMRRAMEQLQSLVSPNQDCPTPTDTKARPSSLGLNSLHKVLLGLSKPSNYFSASQPTVNHFFDSSLNAFQIAAVKFSLTAAEVACIHGPPGTGKTRVLVEVIRQLVYRPNEVSSGDQEISGHNTFKIPAKILVCGASNLAVDNLLERLSLPAPLLTKPPTHSTTIVEGGASSTPIKYYPSIALTRLGHPARVMSSLHSKTLE